MTRAQQVAGSTRACKLHGRRRFALHRRTDGGAVATTRAIDASRVCRPSVVTTCRSGSSARAASSSRPPPAGGRGGVKHAVWVWGGGVGRCARLGNLVPQVGEVGRALELVRAVVLALGQHEEHEEVGGEAREPEQRDHRGQLRARRGGRPQQGSVTRPWNLPTHPRRTARRPAPRVAPPTPPPRAHLQHDGVERHLLSDAARREQEPHALRASAGGRGRRGARAAAGGRAAAAARAGGGGGGAGGRRTRNVYRSRSAGPPLEER